MIEGGVGASVGFFSDAGPRKDNQDFAGAVFGWELAIPRRDVVAAIADGIGGAKGGRVAAETAVRGFLDGFYDFPDTMAVQRSGATIIGALNGWIYSQGHREAALEGMGCTFTAIVLRGRVAHLLHAGDSRAYRLSGGRLARLTADHVRKGPDGGLTRALGVEPEVRLDYITQPVAPHDRFLLCSDGMHGVLADEVVAMILRQPSAPEGIARALVAAALQSGSTDNCTALVLDVLQLPSTSSADISAAMASLSLAAVPSAEQIIDGFALKALLSDGRYSRLFGALDEREGGEVVLKFPKPQATAEETYRAAFVREAWAAGAVNSPFVCRVIDLAPGRQTCLYTVMPLYQGEMLETRLARRPALGLEEGREIAVKLARAAAALHRAGIIHRDIKPDNVILEGGGALKLIDLGVVRIAALEDFPPQDIPGTLAYMAPEMAAGEPGNEATDIFALGVTLFRAFTGEFPYGNPDAVSQPRRERPVELCALRPDLPAWLGAALSGAVARDPADRFSDMTAFAVELEAGPARMGPVVRRPRTFYERAPVLFWQIIAALLALGLILSFLRH
jgi:serine/threonine protein phosphatase PrpC